MRGPARASAPSSSATLPRTDPAAQARFLRVDDRVAAQGARRRARRRRHRGDLSHRRSRTASRRGSHDRRRSSRAGSASATGAGGRCATAPSRSREGRVVGPRRPERRRQDHPAAPGRRAARRRRPARSRCSASARPRRPTSSRGSASSPRTRRLYAGLSVGQPPAHGRVAQPDLGRGAGAAAHRAASASTRARRPGTLSGGQRAQLALTLAIAKRPELLMLDEPVASLDPLARREFLQQPDGGRRRARRQCGALVAPGRRPRAGVRLPVVLADSHVQLAGDVDELLATHHRLTGPRRDPGTLPQRSRSSRRATPSGRRRCSCAPTSRSSTRRGRSRRSRWRTS